MIVARCIRASVTGAALLVLAFSLHSALAQTGQTGTGLPPTAVNSAAAPSVSILNPWALLTATAGLIAFQIGLYTLVGRERKSPYIINSVYPIFLLCLLVAAVALATVLLPEWVGDLLLRYSAALLVLAFAFSALRVYRIAVRSIYFVDSLHLKHLPVIRHWRRWRVLRSPRPNYAHNSIPIAPDLKREIIEILSTASAQANVDGMELDPKALALAVQHQGQGNKLLAQLAEAFLKRSCSVQYLTASRHPIEFMDYLRNHMEGHSPSWAECRKWIVVIDAYSPHFAFLDSIYPRKSIELETLGIARVESKMTYAGMHTASSRAFNIIKEKANDQERRPTLVIYEDSYALVDLESPEQYRIFVRHVVPSERMWGGMFTVFLESAIPDADWRMLQSYASLRLDLRSSTAPVERVTSSPQNDVIPNQRDARMTPQPIEPAKERKQ